MTVDWIRGRSSHGCVETPSGYSLASGDRHDRRSCRDNFANRRNRIRLGSSTSIRSAADVVRVYTL